MSFFAREFAASSRVRSPVKSGVGRVFEEIDLRVPAAWLLPKKPGLEQAVFRRAATLLQDPGSNHKDVTGF